MLPFVNMKTGGTERSNALSLYAQVFTNEALIHPTYCSLLLSF